MITIRRPRRRVQLDRTDGELIMSALADAAAYRELRVQQWCAQCDSASLKAPATNTSRMGP